MTRRPPALTVSQRSPRLTVEAFAKINLGLAIVGSRDDGFHEVRTILQSIDLSDRLVCRPRPGALELRCVGPVPVSDGPQNLVWRAAETLWRATGRPGPASGAAMTLTKRIPVGAGLGGGSADAAAALVALNRLWRLGWGTARLAQVARQLGADVPFFLVGGAALGVGRGDLLYPLPALPGFAVLVLKPSFAVATADAYRWYDEDRAAAAPPPADDFDAAVAPGGETWPGGRRDWLAVLPPMRNDLEPVVGRRYPVIPRLIEALRRHGARFAAMSGSGSAVYGVFNDTTAARAARRRLGRAEAGGRDWSSWVVECRSRTGMGRMRPVQGA